MWYRGVPDRRHAVAGWGRAGGLTLDRTREYSGLLNVPGFSLDKESQMAFRQKMSRGSSRKVFTRNAVRHHSKNTRGNPMRGGIRL